MAHTNVETGQAVEANNPVFNEGKWANISGLMGYMEQVKRDSKDLIAPQSEIEALVEPGTQAVRLRVGQEDYGINRWGMQQIANKTGIPFKYVEAMRQAGMSDLIAHNINEWLKKDTEDKRLIRTTGGTVRAYLSSRYKIIDNYDLALVTLSEAKIAGAVFDTANITETNLYLRALNVSREITIAGDKYFAGVHIRNSEVGASSISISPFLWRAICANGMLYTKAMRQVHLGAEHENGLLAAETIVKEAEVIFLKSRDLVRASLAEDMTAKFAEDLNKAFGVKVADPAQAIQTVTNHFELGKNVQAELLKTLMADTTQTTEQKNSAYGIINAITALAHTKDADTGYELQRVAGDIICEPEVVA